MILTTHGLKIYYEAIGEGPPVLILHGWGASSGTMRPLLKQVRDVLPVRAVALDFPGFGYSDQPPQAWGVGDYRAFVESFMDELGIETADIIAHSFGGRVAIRLAAECPGRVNRLVLVDSGGIRPKRTARYYVKVSIAKVVKFLFKTVPGLAKALQLDRLAARQASEDYRKAGELRGTLVKVVNEDLQSWMPAIQAPTLLVWGELDEATPAADGLRMKQLIPGSRLEVIQGAGHFSFLDHSQEFNELVIPFLRGER